MGPVKCHPFGHLVLHRYKKVTDMNYILIGSFFFSFFVKGAVSDIKLTEFDWASYTVGFIVISMNQTSNYWEICL